MLDLLRGWAQASFFFLGGGASVPIPFKVDQPKKDALVFRWALGI